jgi:hypothetical protein
MSEVITSQNLPELPGLSLSSPKTAFPGSATVTKGPISPVTKNVSQSTKKNIPQPRSQQTIPQQIIPQQTIPQQTIEVISTPTIEIISTPMTPRSQHTIDMSKKSSPTIIVQNSSSYTELITKNNIENELYSLGYSVISKIVTKDNNGNKNVQFLKTINKRGQKVFVYVDVPGYSSVHSEDIVIIENGTSTLSYSIKNGAYNCVSTDVNGVAFEYGSNSICTIIRNASDLKFNEINYVFHSTIHKTHLEYDGCVITYPIIRFSELRQNTDIILSNTDKVVRRLRNAEDAYERNELTIMLCSLNKLNETIEDFNQSINTSTNKLVTTLKHSEDLNNIYLKENMFCNDIDKDDYIKNLNVLIKSNDSIVKLICIMKKAAEKKKEIDKIASEMDDIISFLDKEFADYGC